MAKAAVAAWVACISDLQQLLDGKAQTTWLMMHSVEKLKLHSPLPHAAWKKLVQDAQVICHACAHVPMCPCAARDLQC